MRVFKNLVKLVLIFYIIAIFGEQFMNKYEAHEKFEILINDNDINKNKKINRIILYGSSHCDFGLSAETIEKITKIKTLNLCNYGLERDIYFKDSLEYLLLNTNEKDLIIYATRLNIKENPLEEDGILGLLLPQFRTSISSIYRKIIKKQKDFNEFGDRNFYPKFNNEFFIPEYSIKYEAINNELNKKINFVLDNSYLSSKVIFAITPILTDNKRLIIMDKLNFKCKNKNCNKFLGLLNPLLLQDKNLFILAEHLNKNEGRNIWTNHLIEFLNKNFL